MIEVGQPAPAFTLKDHTGQEVRLSDLRGKKVWLWFFTSCGGRMCTTHALGYRDNLPRFQSKNVAIFGLNDNDQAKAQEWVEREGLPYPILLDTERKVALAYGIVLPDTERYVTNNADGRRPAVIINEQGIVEKTLPDLTSVELQLEALASL